MRLPVPTVMLLVGASSSMAQAIDATAPGCSATCPTGCAPSCATRESELKRALTTFLAAHGTTARYGLAVSPGADTCGSGAAQVLEPISTAEEDRPAELQATAELISTRLQALALRGALHPTGDALASVGALPELIQSNRQAFILLVTDGAPDCADAVQAVADLRARPVKTIVVGFGADTRVPAVTATLDGMAQAGGFTRSCPLGLDAQCGPGGRCRVGGVCERPFVQANNAAELGDFLNALVTVAPPVPVCSSFALDVLPASAASMTVSVNGSLYEPGVDTWSFETNRVVFHGALCDRLEASTMTRPVAVEIRVAP